ncbi:MAG: PD40 domain-containing protein [Deltaproteobacteria bacterium]|nr:PD40 domain-containing protein [Deltaproteobacteria bacterium]
MRSGANSLGRFRHSHFTLAALVFATLAAAVIAANCSAGSNTRFGSGTSTTGPTSSGTGAAAGTGGAGTGAVLFGGSGGGTGGSGPSKGLKITPDKPVIQVEYGVAGKTVQFTATDAGNNEVHPAWSLNTPVAGTIDKNGLFTANGQAGGQIIVAAKLSEQSATANLTIELHILENLAGLPPASQGILQAPGGSPDPSWVIVYPYNGTVFPRGIPAPQIHTNGISGNAVYLSVGMPGCGYEGFLPPTPQIAMSQPAWDALGTCTNGLEAKVELAKLVNNTKVGPIGQSWRIAKGRLHGVIYYNTYDSKLASNGAMLRIKGASTTPEVLVGNCTVCHSVSSDGSTAAAANHSGPGGTFDLSGGNVNPPLIWQDPERAAFAALYPKNGEVLVINGAPGGSWPPNTPGTSGNWTSDLRTKAGQVIPGSGIEGYYAQSPVFSHDGTMLAFCDRKKEGGYPSVLALMDYNNAAHAFSNYQILGMPPGGRHFSWPAFTPDNKYVVFQDGIGDDLATWSNNTAKLHMVNVVSKMITDLPWLNGDGYMPAGQRDENLNYEPTILPISSGGYFWIMFTSRRTYGNLLTGSRGETKRLWVSAFDVTAQDNADPSHPAFYIAGQEVKSGNSRGFWTLDPCKPDGQACESGDECCEGFCNPAPDGPGFVCGQPSEECADEFEHCVTKADCCNQEFDCIGGWCSMLPPH